MEATRYNFEIVKNVLKVYYMQLIKKISDPPENLYISDEVVDVVENEAPEKVLCTAEAYPEANFMWRFHEEIIQTDNLLHFASPITRAQAGVYVCEAQNRHGKSSIVTTMNVLCEYIYIYMYGPWSLSYCYVLAPGQEVQIY